MIQILSNIKILIFPVVMVVALFGSAGRWDLPFVWAYTALWFISTVTGHFTIDPGLRRERLHAGPGDMDRITGWFVLPVLVIHWLIAGWDIGRFHWSDTIPGSLQIIGVIGLAASLGLAFWAVRVNPFFSTALRIQEKRGHRLITAGPYQYVRHPGYAAAISAFFSGVFALGYWWAILPVGVYVVLIGRRTVMEDRFLKEKLTGYAEYAQKVSYRFIPGIW
jgi:protein-S-isoprenylcysteine O-methyltransferase Ste14